MEFESPNYVYRARMVKVVDGDTVDVDLDVGFDCTLRKRLRLLGIDTWETRGEERPKGLLAKHRMFGLLIDCDTLYVQTKMDATGKYGRILAVLWIMQETGPVNVNQLLVDEGHAEVTNY